jgi:hypothetical protein
VKASKSRQMAKLPWKTYGVIPPRKRFKMLWHRVFDGVRYLLWQNWHPIGQDVPHTEYDRYAMTLAGMLLRNCTPSELLDYLAWAEREIWGDLYVEAIARASGRRTTTVERLTQFREDGYPPIAWIARFPGTYMLPKTPQDP